MHSSAPPRGSLVSIGEYDLHYLSEGEGPALVFLHGSGPGASAYSNFKHNIDTAVNSGYRAVLIDMLGFGYSSKPTGLDYTTALFANSVKAALDKLDIERCTLLGNSLGGAICIRLALDYPDLVQRLILMAPGGIEDRETYFAMPAIAEMVDAFVSGELDQKGLRSILETLVFDPSQVTDQLVNERFSILQTQPKDVLSRMVIPSMADQLGDLTCPIYGFWGQQDRLTPVSGAAKFLNQSRHCQFLILASCGHWVMVEKKDIFNTMLANILNNA